jgi:pyruvate,orthophosphate dikinase
VPSSHGNKKADGNGSMKPLLGGKGANLAEMSRIGLPVPPGFTITTEVCTYYYANKKTYPKVLDAQARSRHRLHREDHGHQVRRQDRHAAARLRPLRRARFDARHDGHDSEPRPQRPDRARARRRDQERALRLGLLPPLRPDVRRRRHGRAEEGKDEDHEPFEDRHPQLQARAYHADIEDSKLTAADQQELVKRFKALIKERTGKEFPQDPWKQLWGAPAPCSVPG